MTGLERKDQIIELFLPDDKHEKEVELPPKQPARTMDDLLGELESTQRQLREENDDLAELRRRVDLTEKNMYIHMHSVGNIRHCLEDTASIKDRKMDVLLKGLKKSGKRIATGKNIDKIRAEVDKELGIKPPEKKTAKKNVVIKKGPATKGGIMNSLINMTGRMAEFSNILGGTLKTSGSMAKILPLKKT